jgi:hypothetical protein
MLQQLPFLGLRQEHSVLEQVRVLKHVMCHAVKTSIAFLFQQFEENRHSWWPRAVTTSLPRLYPGWFRPLRITED